MARKSNTNLTQGGMFVRGVTKMPECFYSGDKPNPYLNEFIEKHYVPSGRDDKRVLVAIQQIMTSRGGSLGADIYDQHSYWSKKAYGGIEQYIKVFSKKGEIVLDPFCGSGATLVVAVSAGRNAIGLDLSPSATFISAGYLSVVEPNELLSVGLSISKQVREKLKDAYSLPHGNKDVDAFIISDTCKCIRCLEIIPIAGLIERDGETFCPKCKQEPISTKSRSIEWVDEVIVDAIGEKKATIFPVVKYRHEEAERIRRENLKQLIPETIQKIGRLNTLNIRHAGELFSDRAVICLYHLKCAIEKAPKDLVLPLMFVFSSILLNSSRMYRVREGGGGGPAGNYFVPAVRRDNNVSNLFEAKLREISNAKQHWNNITKAGDAIVSTQSAEDLSNIKSNSVDYIFTDPPYSDKMPYGALNTVWEAWLGLDRKWLSSEIIGDHWELGMRRAVKEMARVLKPGRWVSLCYHDTSEGTWELVQDIFAEAGFMSDQFGSSLHIDTSQRSMQQQKSDKVIKRDLVVNFRKPVLGEILPSLSLTGEEDNKTFNEKVHSIIEEYLSNHQGSTKDRIYDEVVSHMVRAGRMEAHDFEGLLRQVAEEVKEPVKKTLYENEDPNIFGTHEVSRWYLKETEFAETDAAESAKEDAAAEKVEKFIEKKLKEQPWLEGVHYSDIFEQYIYSVKDKPRRQLAEWLLDYFYKTDAGTYRLPQSDEEKKLKAEGRTKGTHRRVKRFIAYLQQGIAIPTKDQPNDATLAEWLCYCKRSGLYDQGKLLYEKGGLNLDNLSEKDMVNAEEDYQVCVRLLARGVAGSGAETTPKRGRKKK